MHTHRKKALKDDLFGRIVALASELWCRVSFRHHYPIIERQYIGKGTIRSFNRWVYQELRDSCPNCGNYPERRSVEVVYRRPIHRVINDEYVYDDCQQTPTSPKEKLRKALEDAIKSGELDRKDETVFPKVIRGLPYDPSIFTREEIEEIVEKMTRNGPRKND